MTDGTPNLKSMPIPPTSSTNAHASQHDDPSSPHAQSLLLHASQAAAAAGLLNQHNASSNANLHFSFPRIDTSVSASSSPFAGGNVSSSSNNNVIEFRSHTIAPSPPPGETASSSSDAAAASDPRRPSIEEPFPAYAPRYHPSPLSAHSESVSSSGTSASGRGRRDSSANLAPGTPTRAPISSLSGVLQHKTSTSSLNPLSRTPSFKASPYIGGLGPGFGTASAASSTYPSPIISAMGDVTPLPSPLLASDSPGPWKRLGGRPPSRDAAVPRSPPSDAVLISSNGESIAAALANQTKRKGYSGLALELNDGSSAARNSSGTAAAGGRSRDSSDGHGKLQQPAIHTRNRSVSEYTPDPMLLPKRMLTVTGSRGGKSGDTTETLQLEMQQKQHSMRREPNLSTVRGLTPVEKPPTPPPSESSLSAADLSSSSSVSGAGSTTATTGGVASLAISADSSSALSSDAQKAPRYEYFEAHRRRDGKLRRWRAVKLLGQGTFSRVMLATSSPPPTSEDEEMVDGEDAGVTHQRHQNQHQYPRRTLVAVKVCEHGPKGGASEDRVEMSLKRELEIMQSIRHPSLVDLRAWSIEPTRAILVLSYCPGGDLFDVATAHRDLLTPQLLRRIFAELVGAVRYLHDRRIVHRDIKLENVLVNISPQELAEAKSTTDWTTYPYAVATLTDLGLSRRVADDERLETRCGSDDYAAPEVIMGQPYDGRAVDGWSLGVLLYALLESRLPFDPLPGAGGGAGGAQSRSRTSHRIARVEWRWVAYAGDDGDHEGDENLFSSKGLLGAMRITEGLLKRARTRWPLSRVAEEEWVRDAICVEGGVRYREEEEGEGLVGNGVS